MKPGSKALKLVLLGFVAVSIGAAVYKAVGPLCCAEKPGLAEAAPAAEPARAPAALPAGKKAAPANTAVVYYFYTDTRCSSCNTIEAYTKEAVETGFKSAYKGWQVTFKGVNTDEAANEHFVQDYWLNSKSVIVQKFSGDKALNWGKLDRVWTLLGDKEAFKAYVVAETHKVLDKE